MDARTRRLLTAPIGSTLLRLAAPNILVMLAQASTGLVETYFVSKLGTDALAGMAMVFPVVMLIQMISAGAMGGGIMSAVSRTLGAGRREDANGLVWHAAAIALLLGVATTILAFAFGPVLYAALGGEGASLKAALTYSNVVFFGAFFMWLFNSLAAVIRGTGNMFFPAMVMTVGALFLVALSPPLIFGWGPVPALGIAGGGLAFVLYYVFGTFAFIAYLWSGRTVLSPSRRPVPLRWAPMAQILKVGVVSSLVSVTTNLTIAVATGFAGTFGPAAVAGYGTGARLEYLLVPLVFGLSAPVAAMVGTAIGAGDRTRALRVAWIGAGLAGCMTEAIGVAAALHPEAWLRLFGDDPAMIETGSAYLRTVGPFFGAFGAGLALYFASQGAGRVGWPLVGGILRVIIAVGGGWLAIQHGGGLTGVFWAIGLALLAFPIVNAGAILLGAWFPGERKLTTAPAE